MSCTKQGGICWLWTVCAGGNKTKPLRVRWIKPLSFSVFQAKRDGANTDLGLTHDHAKKEKKKGDTDGNFVVKLHPGSWNERETQRERKRKPKGEKVRWSGQGWRRSEFAHLISSGSFHYVSTRLFNTVPIFSPLPCLVLSSALLVIGCHDNYVMHSNTRIQEHTSHSSLEDICTLMMCKVHWSVITRTPHSPEVLCKLIRQEDCDLLLLSRNQNSRNYPVYCLLHSWSWFGAHYVKDLNWTGNLFLQKYNLYLPFWVMQTFIIFKPYPPTTWHLLLLFSVFNQFLKKFYQHYG